MCVCLINTPAVLAFPYMAYNILYFYIYTVCYVFRSLGCLTIFDIFFSMKPEQVLYQLSTWTIYSYLDDKHSVFKACLYACTHTQYVCCLHTLTAADDQREGISTYIYVLWSVIRIRLSQNRLYVIENLGKLKKKKSTRVSMKGDPDIPIFLPIDFTNTSQPRTLYAIYRVSIISCYANTFSRINIQNRGK